MSTTAVPRGTRAPAPRPLASLDDILLELVDIDDNVRDDVGELAELQASIAELGLLSPVKVTAQADGRYRLVYGQRRVLACRALGRLVRQVDGVDRHLRVDDIDPRTDLDLKADLTAGGRVGEGLPVRIKVVRRPIATDEHQHEAHGRRDPERPISGPAEWPHPAVRAEDFIGAGGVQRRLEDLARLRVGIERERSVHALILTGSSTIEAA